MNEINTNTSVSYSYNSDEMMYNAAYKELSGGGYNINTNSPNVCQTNNRQVRDLIPYVDINELLEKRDRMLAGEKDKDYVDLHEINAAIGLAYSLRDLNKLLNDPSISDSDALRLYNTLITYIEYNGNSAEKENGKNMDHGLDDIINKIKNNNNSLNFDWEGDRPDGTYFRELATFIEISLKKIKEETTIDIPDKKQKLAEAYFTGNRGALDYWSDKKEDYYDR